MFSFLRGLHCGDAIGFGLFHCSDTVRFGFFGGGNAVLLCLFCSGNTVSLSFLCRLNSSETVCLLFFGSFRRSHFDRIHSRLRRNDIQKLHLENQQRIGRNHRRSPFSSITEIARNPSLHYFAGFHQSQQFLPSLNHSTNRKFQRFSALYRAVEFGSIQKGSCIVDSDFIRQYRGFCRRVDGFHHIFILQSAGRGNHPFRRLILFQKDVLRIQRRLCSFDRLLFPLHLHLQNEFLQSLFRLGIGHQKRISVHLIAQRFQEQFLINFSVHIFNRAPHIHAKRITIPIFSRNQRVFFYSDHRRVLRSRRYRSRFWFRSARTSNKCSQNSNRQDTRSP